MMSAMIGLSMGYANYQTPIEHRHIIMDHPRQPLRWRFSFQELVMILFPSGFHAARAQAFTSGVIYAMPHVNRYVVTTHA